MLISSRQASSIQAAQELSAGRSGPEHLYRANFFGPFRVMRGDQPVDLGRRTQAKALLKWFLLHPGRMFATDQLTTLFWPDLSIAAAARNLHVALNYLRHALEPDLPARQKSTFIQRNTNNLYNFDLKQSWWADIFDIQRHLLAAQEAERQRDVATMVAHYREIAEYYRLEFLPEDAYEDIFSTHRRHYERSCTQILQRLLHLCTQLKLFDDVFAYSQQILRLDPYCESAMKAMIGVYLQQGNVSGAIHKMEDFRRLLKHDLGIEPGEELLALGKSLSETAQRSSLL